MKNVYEVLRRKELALSKVESEVQALRVATRLLSDNNEGSEGDTTLASATVLSRPDWMPLAVDASPRHTDASQSEDKAKNWP